MNDYARDIWQDLRDKRLWPVAVVLALAIVAIPLLLTKSAAQPAADQVVVPAATEETRVAVDRDDDDAASSGRGSALDRFAEGDPFTPPGAITAKGGATASASSAGPSGDAGGSTGSGGGSEPPSSSPDVPSRPPQTHTETAEFEYVADVTFWNGDRRRELRGLRKLDMLPNQSAPVLIFMGTSDQGGNAVFLVDSTLKTTGEGHCVPDRANCAYVHIGPGSEQLFTTEAGDAYRLRVDEIRRVRTRAAGTSANPSASSSTGDGPPLQRFQLPSLTDLVEVSTTTTAAAPTAGSSNPAGGR